MIIMGNGMPQVLNKVYFTYFLEITISWGAEMYPYPQNLKMGHFQLFRTLGFNAPILYRTQLS